MAEGLTWEDIQAAAAMLEVEPCALMAVCQVESAGNGFLPSGKPKILFEGHIFWKELKKRGLDPQALASGNEDILYPKWARQHYKGGEAEYGRLERARAIHEEAALCACSWGMFQIMGFNCGSCGCETVQEFVEKQQQSSMGQLQAVCHFLKRNGLDRPLRSRDWAAFARGYNGPGYAENKYDEKLRQAYEKCAREHGAA